MIIGICFLVMILYLFRGQIRRYFRGAQFTELVSAKKKIVIVTGGNGGIGSRVACGLNKRGAKVYQLCRNVEKAKSVNKRLVLEDGCVASRLIVVYCDLSDMKSIRAAVAFILSRVDKWNG